MISSPKTVMVWMVFFVHAVLPASSLAQGDASRPPNFVLIFTDDQGYGDLSSFGATHVSTPHIDRLAAEGARLTSFYVAAPVCTPSRAALMTGSYPKRVSMTYGSDFIVLLDGDPKGLNPDEITVAEVLKTRGYATGLFGKWHLGDQPEFLPTRQGFDEFYGLPYSHDIHPYHPRQDYHRFTHLPLLEGESVIEAEPNADLLTKNFTDRAVSFIDRHKDEPFFLYVPHPIPHTPLHVSEPYMKGVSDEVKAKLALEDGNIDYTTRRLMFRQAINEIDDSVGRIVEALKRNGLDRNTLVIFTSDNGPAIGSAGPLRGRKGSAYEGGVREATVAWWPGRIPAGHVSDELVTAMDLLPTFAHLAGAEVPRDRVIDGKDIFPILADAPGARSPHDRFFYHQGNYLRAVRSGDWKLYIGPTPRGKDAKPPAPELYNLRDDLGEQDNLAAQHPDIVARLMRYFREFDAELGPGNEYSANCRPAGWVENAVPLVPGVPGATKP
ncbi:MAG: sulfatase family protein [Planctomycetota bacterium]|jgi:arylsulfatase A-like enzyme